MKPKVEQQVVSAAKWILGIKERIPAQAHLAIDVARKLGELLPTRESGLLRGSMQMVTAVHEVAKVISPRMTEDPMVAFVRKLNLVKGDSQYLSSLIFGTPLRKVFNVTTSSLNAEQNVTCARHPEAGAFYWRHGREREADELAMWMPECWHTQDAALEKVVDLLWTSHEGRMRAGMDSKFGDYFLTIAPMARTERALYAGAQERMQKLAARHRRYKARGVARAYMFHGPPGMGKTTCALAMADEIGTRLLRVEPKVLSVLGFDKLRAMVEKLTPDFLLVDDVDKDGGEDFAVLDMVEAMKEAMPKVGLAFTSNRVDGFDKGLMRPGRIDTWVAFELPEADERRQVLLEYLRAFGLPVVDDDVERLVQASEGLAHDYLRDAAGAYADVGDDPEALNEIVANLVRMRDLVEMPRRPGRESKPTNPSPYSD